MLSTKEIKHIAGLARIGLNKEEISRYKQELSSVLDYFKKLEKVDTENIKQVGHITRVHSIYKDDIVKKNVEDVHKQIMKNIPQIKNDQVKVRSVL